MTTNERARRLTCSLELLWQTDERQARGPKRTLSLDRIVDAAIEVADAEGVAGISMRKVAGKLGVGTMSLYRYVPGKAELLDLMLDRLSEPSDAAKQAFGQGWRATFEAMARDTYALYVNHPWLLQINWSRPVFGPNTLAGVELAIGVIDGLGLTDRQRVMALTVIDSFCVGAARSQVQYTTAAEETGVSDDEFWAAQLPVLERAMASGDFPALASLAEDSFDAGWEETLEFGLRCLLDGLEKFIEGRCER